MAITGLVVLVWRRFDRVEVSGLSMAPTLQPGDRLVVWRTRSVRPGDIVAAPDPRQPERTVLKRVTSVDPEGVFLMGDNPVQSTDSRQFGRVPIKSLLGKAIYRYAPPGRAGRLSCLNGGRVLENDFAREMGTAGWTVSVWANGPGDTYTIHTHSYKKVLCCLEGSIVFHTDRGDIALKEGDRMVLEPGTPHSATVGQEGVRCAEAHALS